MIGSGNVRGQLPLYRHMLRRRLVTLLAAALLVDVGTARAVAAHATLTGPTTVGAGAEVTVVMDVPHERDEGTFNVQRFSFGARAGSTASPSGDPGSDQSAGTGDDGSSGVAAALAVLLFGAAAAAAAAAVTFGMSRRQRSEPLRVTRVRRSSGRCRHASTGARHAGRRRRTPTVRAAVGASDVEQTDVALEVC
jgi:hypothetical protein